MTTRVILDTDIGTDVDDLLALALILQSPELQLEGVTCVYGDVDLRARMVRKVLRLYGRADVPVYAGMRRTLMGLRDIYWAGHEGMGLLEPEDDALTATPGDAVDYLVQTVTENPGAIHVIAIGPLTNIAMAFLREPRLAQNLAHLTIMGGVVRSGQRLDLPYAEHNIICDAEAAHVVMTSGAPITLVPLDVTTRVRIRPEDTVRIHAGGTAFHAAVAGQVEAYPPFAHRRWTHLHDPLAVAAVIQPDLVTLVDVHVDVETSGRYSYGATLMHMPSEHYPANARVALEVDAPRFEAFLTERLAQPIAP